MEINQYNGSLYIYLEHPGTPSVLFLQATVPLKPATITLKIGHLALRVEDNRSPRTNGTVELKSQITSFPLMDPWEEFGIFADLLMP